MERDNSNVTQTASAHIMQWKVSASSISNKAAMTNFQTYAYLLLLRKRGVVSCEFITRRQRVNQASYVDGDLGESVRLYFRIPAQQFVLST
jgi:uncharacterized membrane-anchored protein